jgi:Glycosyl hydrolases family 39
MTPMTKSALSQRLACAFYILSLAALPGFLSIRVHAQSAVVADFGSRTTATQSIPANMFGITLSQLQDTRIFSDLSRYAGITQSRMMAAIPQVYATRTPNWTQIDSYMTNVVKPYGFRPLLMLSLTPSWLQPSPTPCTTSNPDNAPTTNIGTWAQIAASYVAHMDHTFPGLVHDYEIWNEPELQKSFCVADGTDATRLKTYLALYAAAAKAMRAQAALDGVKIRIGGPSISNLSLASEWISALLTNSSTAPQVDFVSYHMYLTGIYQIQTGMNWNTLYSFTQSATKGEVYTYKAILQLVRNGLQPGHLSTPIYITEYNDNWVPAKDCCRNDPTFGPLWNSVAIVNFLNTVYAGATYPPAEIFYYAGSQAPYFCIAGTWDLNMDCNPSAMQLYPQYYAFRLFGAYLGLRSGAHMAVSVSSANTTSGLLATAFYTSGGDTIVIVNPTATTYLSLKVVAKNAGLNGAVATAIELGPASPQVATRSLGMTESAGTYSGSISVPAYSTVAVTIKPN